ncbi:MAG: holo-ACP synthase [Defluviitaleaceae bacterium]|nr:holo-ACP synthase [Defluviitaleaceae bacterium]
MGIGVDMVKVERFKDITPHFRSKVYTPQEQAYLTGKKIESLAGIFAAKEAVAKALGTGFIAGLRPIDIEILHDKNGKPYVNSHKNIEISISHTATDAIAFAVVT